MSATSGDASDPLLDATILLRPCEFDPQVVALRLGAALLVRSDDTAIHFCVLVRPSRNNRLNTHRVRGGEVRFEPTERELWIPLDRDCHSYTSAWVTVFDAERFDITTPDGDFEISGLVPGRRKLHIRHPLFGRERLEFDVDVSALGVTTLDLTLP